MATVEESGAHDDVAIKSETPPKDIESLKRKASVDEGEGEGSPKRFRQDDQSRRRSSASHREPPSLGPDRNRTATTEEKKRGKRLFGGLLSTLSQTGSNTQHKRRLEIERRQQERLQKQSEEDEQKRAEKRERMREIRMTEQIVFDEEVMRNRHTKKLALAGYLRTRAEPHIYYLPYKLTADQQDEIDDQIKDAKEVIEEESETFKIRKERHIKEYGQPQRIISSLEPVEAVPPRRASVNKPAESANGSDRQEQHLEKEQHHQHSSHHNHHDESADVLEEADEDMVIY